MTASETDCRSTTAAATQRTTDAPSVHGARTDDCPPGSWESQRTADARPEVRHRFFELSARWERETLFLSNPDQMRRFASYAEVVAMGWPVVRLLLERMAAPGGNWHWHMAVRDITGHSPRIAKADYGKVEVIRAAWLNWGRANGLLR